MPSEQDALADSEPPQAATKQSIMETAVASAGNLFGGILVHSSLVVSVIFKLPFQALISSRVISGSRFRNGLNVLSIENTDGIKIRITTELPERQSYGTKKAIFFTEEEPILRSLK